MTATDEASPADDLADFERLFEAHAGDLHRYLGRLVGAMADDLVGDTFVAALKGRGGFDPARASARAWLFGIATNLARNHLRRRKREDAATARLRDAALTESHENRVVDQMDAQLRARQLAVAIAELNAADRDVLLLTSWAGLDANEIAEALGIPAGTVRSRLHRVRKHLRVAAPQIDLGSADVDR
ncbi:RNA polymerase sigma factor [Kutzneria buriramensis]|uniref:RNA polymerase sigma-70 factor (ECF subfamily) n=1 Tax=Kutzneria buriramensis TaxID=1045776 RepID=A0A3E0GW55_9PSEU|nr:RNA polymerase sigma factor [Kutzneria buriramensis]REH28499.1 RNA polymerase sigma-70 factor (ECF subfamily) [Kutzneria buriramensis]